MHLRKAPLEVRTLGTEIYIFTQTSLSFNHLIAEMAAKAEFSFSPFVQIANKSF